MSIILLTVLVLLIGAVAYMPLKRLVRPVRVVGACVLMVSLVAFIIQNRETIARQGIFSEKRARNVPNSTDDFGSVTYVTFQSISEEDHNFLIEILQKQNQDGQQQDKPAPTQVENVYKAEMIGSSNEPVLKGELVINTAEVKRSDPVTHKETVKRAQLVTHNETFKRAELVRSSRQWFPVITASQELLKKPPGVIRYSVSFTKDIPELLDRARKLGLEGLIGKRRGSR